MQDKIKSYIESKFNVKFDGESLSVDSDLFESGIVDSVGVIELVSFIEQEFEVRLNDEDLMSVKMTTISGIKELIQNRA